MIVKEQSQNKAAIKPSVSKAETRSDRELKNSKKPIRSKPVVLRHFHFIE